MQKDTRANLIFLTIFLAISLPGGVILFMKKLDPAVPAMSLPPPPRTQIPYLSPMDASDLKRYVPERTGRWVREITQSHGFDPTLRDGLPIMSPHRMVQLAGVKSEKVISLLIWADEAVQSTDVTVQDASIDKLESLDVPPDVRKELIYAGFAQPPKQVAWVEITLPPGTPLPSDLHINISNRPESLPLLAHR